MRAENLYALHLMLNHEKLRDMNFGRDKPGDTDRAEDELRTQFER
jgi:hypothetical protein